MAPNTKTLDAHELGHLGHEPEGNTCLLPGQVHQVKRGEPHTGPKPPACTWADTDVYFCCAHRPTARIAASMRETEIEEWKYIECICIHTHAGANGAHLHVSQWPQGWAKNVESCMGAPLFFRFRFTNTVADPRPCGTCGKPTASDVKQNGAPAHWVPVLSTSHRHSTFAEEPR